jgi:hypothetical protein
VHKHAGAVVSKGARIDPGMRTCFLCINVYTRKRPSDSRKHPGFPDGHALMDFQTLRASGMLPGATACTVFEYVRYPDTVHPETPGRMPEASKV